MVIDKYRWRFKFEAKRSVCSLYNKDKQFVKDKGIFKLIQDWIKLEFKSFILKIASSLVKSR